LVLSLERENGQDKTVWELFFQERRNEHSSKGNARKKLHVAQRLSDWGRKEGVASGAAPGEEVGRRAKTLSKNSKGRGAKPRR